MRSPAISSQVSRVSRRRPSPSAPSTRATRRSPSAGPDSGGAAGVQPDRPDTGRLQRDQRAGDVDRAQQRHGLQRAGRGLGERAGLLRRVAVLGDHRRHAERRGRAQDGADVARVGDLVEHDQRPGPFQRLLQAGRGQRIGEQRGALVGDVAAEQVVEPAALDLLGRHRPGRRLALRQGLLGLLGQHQAAQAAGRIGQRGGHRVQAVEPDGAAGRVRNVLAGGVVALAVGAVEVVARALAVLVVLVGAGLERLALGTRAAVVRLAVRSAGLAGARIARGAPGLARGVVAPLLAVVGLAVGGMEAGRAAWAAAAAGGRPATGTRRTARAWRAPGAAVAIGVGRFHWRRV